MGRDLYHSIPEFFEKRMAEHSIVSSYTPLPIEDEFIYRICRDKYDDEILVWLADQYYFTDMDFYNRPRQLRPGDYIVIAKPEATGGASRDLITQFRIGVGKLKEFMGALNTQKMWTYIPPSKKEKAHLA